MRARSVGLLATAALLLTSVGCSGDRPPPPAAPSATPAAVVAAYDAALEPAAAVLPLVPDGAETLLVTDFDRVRAELGADDLSTASPVADQEAFWTRAASEAPLLSTGLLRPVEGRLRADHGLSQSDVAWEAHFLDAAGTELGWVLAMRGATPPASVERAVAGGVGPLAGSTWRAADSLVVSGVAADGTSSWAADAATSALVGPRAIATYVERGCEEPRAPAPGAAELEELTAYSVQFENTLATARLGPDRLDLFDRMRQATATPSFAAAFEGGVSDPSTGRIGFRMIDPAAAAQLALDRQLPFTACGDE